MHDPALQLRDPPRHQRQSQLFQRRTHQPRRLELVLPLPPPFDHAFRRMENPSEERARRAALQPSAQCSRTSRKLLSDPSGESQGGDVIQRGTDHRLCPRATWVADLDRVCPFHPDAVAAHRFVCGEYAGCDKTGLYSRIHGQHPAARRGCTECHSPQSLRCRCTSPGAERITNFRGVGKLGG